MITTQHHKFHNNPKIENKKMGVEEPSSPHYKINPKMNSFAPLP